jgi:long-subunit fatty acid transport protein
VAEASLRALTRWPVCCSGGKTGQAAIAAAEAQAAREAAQEQHASAAEQRNTNDAVAVARARYLARKKAGVAKGRRHRLAIAAAACRVDVNHHAAGER